MVRIGKTLIGLLALFLLAAAPSGCVNVNDGPRPERSPSDVVVGGDRGVVVERGGDRTAVKVGGDWIASDLVAGAVNAASGNTNFGDGNDHSIGVGSAITASIASITIGGQVFGTPISFSSTDHFGFVAQFIHSMSVAGAPVPLTGGADNIPLGPSGDVNLVEV